MKQTRQAVCPIKQSILLRCLWLKSNLDVQHTGLRGRLVEQKLRLCYNFWVVAKFKEKSWLRTLSHVVVLLGCSTNCRGGHTLSS